MKYKLNIPLLTTDSIIMGSCLFPNVSQFAICGYLLFVIHNENKQLWQIPAF
jgi:hypothetical protein